MLGCAHKHGVVTFSREGVRGNWEMTFLPSEVTPGIPMVIVALVGGEFCGASSEAVAVTLTDLEAQEINLILRKKSKLSTAEIDSAFETLYRIQTQRRPDLFELPGNPAVKGVNRTR